MAFKTINTTNEMLGRVEFPAEDDIVSGRRCKHRKLEASTMVFKTINTTNEMLGRARVEFPAEDDIVSGRGGFVNHHGGNKAYLELLAQHEEAYAACKRKYQKLLSLCIIHQLRCQGVRFLKKDQKSGNWSTVKLSQCRLKISQRLRERRPYWDTQMRSPGATGSTASIPAAEQDFAPLLPVPAPLSDRADTKVVTDASSDEEGSESSSIGGESDDTSLGGLFEQVFGFDPLEPLTGDGCKRVATTPMDFTIACQPQRKRQRTQEAPRWLDPVASSAQELPLTSKYTEGLLQDDLISVCSDFPSLDGQLDTRAGAVLSISLDDDDMFEYLELLL